MATDRKLQKSSSISSFLNKMKSQSNSERTTPETDHNQEELPRRKSGIFSFGKRRRSDDDEEDEGETVESTSEEDYSEHASDEAEEGDESTNGNGHYKHDKHVAKKRRRMSEVERQKQAKIDAEIAAKEAELDALLEPQYRKFRPRGFKFNPPPKDRPIRVYADGVFDLFHLGHMKQLEQAKTALPNTTLICGIPSDKQTHLHKGLTVLSDKQRAESLRHCRWVDEVIEDCPWSVDMDFLIKNKIDYVAHDDLPYASVGDDDIYKPVKEQGMFLSTQRTEGISTSDIITKIIRDYDKYLMRNFARGASRKDLNVSWLKKNELDLKRHVSQFRESFKTGFEHAKNRDIYSEIMGYIANHLSPASTRRIKNTPRRRPQSPATDFASNYSGGTFFGNVKGWVSRKMDHFDSRGGSISPSPAEPASPEHDHDRESDRATTRRASEPSTSGQLAM